MAVCVEPHKRWGEILNEYFPSVFTEKIMEAKELREINYDALDQMQITKEELLAVLKWMKSPVPDQVHAQPCGKLRKTLRRPLQ